jgi:transcription initiation protein SPT3
MTADHQQLSQATALANRRGVRSISVADLIFLIRHDKAKVSRLRTFLSWKDVRKNVKDSDDKGGADAGDAADFGDDVSLPTFYKEAFQPR